MDEATSALDKFSEKKVISYFDNYLKGKTTFVITHNQYEYDRILQKKHDLAEIISGKQNQTQ
jgi:ABC-type bacteriocin/lantibiotic exporter with double-glycine peptidase domain